MPNDLMNEYLNLALARTLPNGKITFDLIKKKSKSLYFAHQARIEYLKQHGEIHSRTHKEIERMEEFNLLLSAMDQADSFVKIEGRQGYLGFEDVPDNIYIHKNSKDQHSWLTGHIKKFAKLGHLHTDSTLNVAKESLEMEVKLDEADEYVCVLRSRAIQRS